MHRKKHLRNKNKNRVIIKGNQRKNREKKGKKEKSNKERQKEKPQEISKCAFPKDNRVSSILRQIGSAGKFKDQKKGKWMSEEEKKEKEIERM